MSAQADPNVKIYWCVVCGPVLCLLDGEEGDDHLTYHFTGKVHPFGMTFDEELRVQ